MLFVFLFCAVYSLSYDVNKIVGYGAKATGGAGGSVVKVTTRDELDAALKASGKAIILITSSITIPNGNRVSQEVHDKTILGLPGVKLVSNDQESKSGGILNLKSGSDNVIIRNLIFEGPGAYDVNGNDLITNGGTTNFWVDHCEFYDGLDGNFDNNHESDNITISWNKFGYKKAPKAGGSGGSDDHRFSNLVGSSDNDAPADGHFSITFQFNWWSDGCRERMPRARNAQLHILNNLYDTSVTDSTALGFSEGNNGLTAYVEGCYFKRIGKVMKADYKGTPSITFVNCLNGTSNVGDTVGKPSYSYSAISASEVEAAITGACGAGQTLKVDSSGNASC
jgi:pectate lyase